MEYVIYVVHQRFDMTKETSKKLLGSFPSYSEAKVFCNYMMSNPKNNYMDLEISPLPLLFNIDEKPCARVDPKNHIPFDLSQMEFPVRCDLCAKNARFFCITHSGLYCLFHVSMFPCIIDCFKTILGKIPINAIIVKNAFSFLFYFTNNNFY